MKEVAEIGEDLETEQRNLLSVAYKNVVGARRGSWRVVNSLEQQSDDERKKQLSKDYRLAIEKELEQICTEVIVCDNVSVADNPVIILTFFSRPYWMNI